MSFTDYVTLTYYASHGTITNNGDKATMTMRPYISISFDSAGTNQQIVWNYSGLYYSGGTGKSGPHSGSGADSGSTYQPSYLTTYNLSNNTGNTGTVYYIGSISYSVYDYSSGWAILIESGTYNIDASKSFSLPDRPLYTITIGTDGHGNAKFSDGTAGATHEFYYGRTCKIEAKASTGYDFSSWNGTTKDNPYSFAVHSTGTYTAYFTEKEFTLTMSDGGHNHGTVSPDGKTTHKYSEIVTIIATPKDGYKFLKWDDGTENNPYQFMMEKDRSYTSIWQLESTNHIYNNSSWKKGLLYIYNDGAWHAGIPYVYNGSEWKKYPSGDPEWEG